MIFLFSCHDYYKDKVNNNLERKEVYKFCSSDSDITLKIQMISNDTIQYYLLNNTENSILVYKPRIEYGETMGMTRVIFRKDTLSGFILVNFVDTNNQGSIIKVSKLLLNRDNSILLPPLSTNFGFLKIDMSQSILNRDSGLISININSPYIKLESSGFDIKEVLIFDKILKSNWVRIPPSNQNYRK